MIRDLGQMRAFLGVVQHGSLGRAAQELHVTQSALTRIIRRLEDQLGVPLFDRHASGMALTPYGAALEPYASLLVAESANAVREIEALRGLSKGIVRVGSVASAIENMLPAAVEKLLTQWPGLHVNIVEGLDEELSTWLEKGEIDLAISFSMPETDDLIKISESGWQDGCHIVAAKTHPLRSKARLELSDLAGAKWVLPPRKMGPREEWHQMFLKNGYPPPEVAVETRSVGAIRSLVRRAGFLSWLPDLLLVDQGGEDSIEALGVANTDSLRHFAVYRRRFGLLSQPAAKLLEELRTTVRELRPCDRRQQDLGS
ncbi:LysR family transcriptional regulator [Variovorax sp. J22R24]|uniref:LysR family transcriptional regulator n=1 Tax=Variovorax gracilis TaxID=3053502 RepID=UPI0025767B1F|nr:LysR family transcriptional regulator [Variovorax sp. J22R24]MDM0110396.1 LysR family transcriptional regulator [Variovorax sp. J22R24]